MRLRHAYCLFIGVSVGLGASLLSADEPPAKNGTRTYLSDLQEIDSEIQGGEGKLGKAGRTGFSESLISVDGKPSPHGLGMHPQAYVTYDIGGKYKSFRAVATIDDSARAPCECGLMFVVDLDGATISQSPFLYARGDRHEFFLNIEGAESLTIAVWVLDDKPGDLGDPFAVWLEPYVSTEPVPQNGELPPPSPSSFLEKLAGDEYQETIRELLATEKYAELDAAVDEARKSRQLWAGDPQLSWFHRALIPAAETTPEELATLFQQIERWYKAAPQSTTAQITYARALISTGWQARGSGAGIAVAPGRAVQFDRNLSEARILLHQARKAVANDPQINVALASCCVGIGDDDDPAGKIDKLLDSALKLDPNYHWILHPVVQYYLPRWHGQKGDVEALAERVRKRLGGTDGDIAYARIAGAAARWARYDTPRVYTFDADLVRTGSLALARKFPADLMALDRLCFWACVHNDRATARLLFPYLQVELTDFRVWGNANYFEMFRDWARDEHPRDDASQTLRGLRLGIASIAWTPGSDALWGAGFGYTVGYWDAAEGELLSELSIGQDVLSLSVAPDLSNLLIATFSFRNRTGRLLRYDMQGESREPLTVANLPVGVGSVAYAPDGKLYAAASNDAIVRIFSGDDHRELRKIEHEDAAFDVVFSPDGRTLATSLTAGGVYLWDRNTGESLRKPLFNVAEGPWEPHLLFSKDGGLLYILGLDGTLRAWNVADGTQTMIIPGPVRSARAFAIAPNGDTAAVCRYDGRVELWSLRDKRMLHEFRGHYGRIFTARFSPDGKRLATGGIDMTIKLWDVSRF